MTPAGSIRLAIDSATDHLSVAAERPGGRPIEETVTAPRRHAVALPALLDRILSACNAGPADLGLVAVSDGPGSFTGLRVGVAVAKALAHSAAVPLVTAPSLLVRAVGGAERGGRVLALTAALRGEVYVGAWAIDRERGVETMFGPRPMGSPGVRDLPDVVDCIVGDGPTDILDALRDRYRLPITPAWPSAASLLGLINLPGGVTRVVDLAEWEPRYGRPAEAQVQWERAHGRPLSDAARDAR